MKESLINLLKPLEISPEYEKYIITAILLVALIIIAYLSDLLFKKIFLNIAARAAKKSKSNWDDILLEKRFFHRVSHIIPGIIVYQSVPYIFDFDEKIELYIQKGINIYFTVLFVIIVTSLLNATLAIYDHSSKAKRKSIKSYIQVGKIILYFFAGILIFSIISGNSAFNIFAGLGAFAAILLLVFQDAIKGLVSGVQLSANDMVRIGDWISMPKYGADGDVIEISLTTIKVQNWDKTISMIPSYALVSNSFSNWRGMEESGGRRIKRSIFIDVNSIHFLSEEEKKKLSEIALISDYIQQKNTELAEYNKKVKNADIVPVNGRNLTNIGTFRVYLEAFLSQNKDVNHDMTFMVRQLQSTEQGLPIEVYCFSKVKSWVEYEAIQADIFDHIFASVQNFNLELFQNPTGQDFKQLSK